jgi:hypothetical protein
VFRGESWHGEYFADLGTAIVAASSPSLYGGVMKQCKWKSAKYKDKYLFPKRAMSVVFRAKFMEQLRRKLEVPQVCG